MVIVIKMKTAHPGDLCLMNLIDLRVEIHSISFNIDKDNIEMFVYLEPYALDKLKELTNTKSNASINKKIMVHFRRN